MVKPWQTDGRCAGLRRGVHSDHVCQPGGTGGSGEQHGFASLWPGLFFVHTQLPVLRKNRGSAPAAGPSAYGTRANTKTMTTESKYWRCNYNTSHTAALTIQVAWVIDFLCYVYMLMRFLDPGQHRDRSPSLLPFRPQRDPEAEASFWGPLHWYTASCIV